MGVASADDNVKYMENRASVGENLPGCDKYGGGGGGQKGEDSDECDLAQYTGGSRS